ncbi:hypothetical protein OG898_07845 [Streptomyces sp. NBC_00193]|uniref:hypothetical protein n=1 Tax=Streptomyces sp. NBC_00193 TaxID=2975675 RepID=UPI00225815F6|nr:hypothetical protein [Streptomyces sp. NBC_00193]MCX5296403.1 hypothetical protein [Streptomyces sp. NBC_00193]
MPAHLPLSRPLYEPADRIPALADLRAHVHRQDWGAVAAAFDALGDEDDRAIASRVVGEQHNAEPFLNGAMADDPGDPLVRSLLAERMIRLGWAVRSSARAHDVPAARFQQFHGYLRRAELLLIDVCAEHPRYALAWYLRTITSRGLQLGPGETRRRYERLAEHHPHHYAGQQQLLQQLCPKWGGSWETAHAFAGECARTAPPGGPGGALVAIAQLEQYAESLDGSDTRRAEKYLATPENRAHLLAAARHSVLHPDARAEAYAHTDAHNAFAAAHSAAARPADAAPHFRVLGDRASRFPWDYLGTGDHTVEFVRHRKNALATG